MRIQIIKEVYQIGIQHQMGEIVRPNYAPLASHVPSVLSEYNDFPQFFLCATLLKLPLNFYIAFKMYV